jgi:hypothetical protein
MQTLLFNHNNHALAPHIPAPNRICAPAAYHIGRLVNFMYHHQVPLIILASDSKLVIGMADLSDIAVSSEYTVLLLLHSTVIIT